ncbi:unnamed protein product [Moneuplotes crassus]|uniref:non-specific serine/threonine protein kinase n=1 Tax=Euplotes crassus TaxID=5936 RepID=A0AAD1XBU0_EUPCR|nr:unnamed protein product [Moneuplotes crassus]
MCFRLNTNYSTVYKVRRLSDYCIYALKKVKLGQLNDKEKANALNEVRILASINHQNIIQYKEAFIDEHTSNLCIVMEYGENGDLYERILNQKERKMYLPENHIWKYFIQITRALAHLHSMDTVHRDLKCANVFLMKDGTIKLGDLNVSKVCHGESLMFTQTGTPYYASPEVWRDKPYDYKCDIWSLGCVLYEITTLNPPFKAKDMKTLFKKVVKGHYPDIPYHYSDDLRNIIAMCLRVNMTSRPGASHLLQTKEVTKKMFLFEDECENNENTDPNQSRDTLLQTIKIKNNRKDNIFSLNNRLPKSKYNGFKSTKRSQSHEIKGSNPPNIFKEVFGRQSKRRLNTSKLTLLKKKINQSSSIQRRMKENENNYDNEFRPENNATKPRIGTVPQNKGIKKEGVTRIVLPKIRKKGYSNLENSHNGNNICLMKNCLPNLSKVHKSTHEMLPKERYLKYKSLLNKKKVETERYPPFGEKSRLQSSNSSQNMNAQEMALDKVYGTIDQQRNKL